MNKNARILWRVPSLKDVLENVLESEMPDDILKTYQEKVQKERKTWKPSPAAWQLFLKFKREFLNKEVEIQIWDNIMHHLGDDEGPFPIRALCTQAVTANKDEIIQAYLGLKNPYSISTHFGYDGRDQYLQYSSEDNIYWLNFADIESIKSLS